MRREESKKSWAGLKLKIQLPSCRACHADVVAELEPSRKRNAGQEKTPVDLSPPRVWLRVNTGNLLNSCRVGPAGVGSRARGLREVCGGYQ